MRKSKTPGPVQPLTWKQRLTALGNLPRFFRLVWQTSPGIMITNCLLRIARSAIPVIILYVGKLIIDQVVLLAKTGGTNTPATITGTFWHPTSGSLNYLWELVALEFGLALLSDALARSISLMDSLLGDRFSNFTSI